MTKLASLQQRVENSGSTTHILHPASGYRQTTNFSQTSPPPLLNTALGQGAADTASQQGVNLTAPCNLETKRVFVSTGDSFPVCCLLPVSNRKLQAIKFLLFLDRRRKSTESSPLPLLLSTHCLRIPLTQPVPCTQPQSPPHLCSTTHLPPHPPICTNPVTTLTLTTTTPDTVPTPCPSHPPVQCTLP